MRDGDLAKLERLDLGGSVNDLDVSVIQQEVQVVQRRGVFVLISNYENTYFKPIKKSFLDDSELITSIIQCFFKLSNLHSHSSMLINNLKQFI